jgi:hypothetical protein
MNVAYQALGMDKEETEKAAKEEEVDRYTSDPETYQGRRRSR